MHTEMCSTYFLKHLTGSHRAFFSSCFSVKYLNEQYQRALNACGSWIILNILYYFYICKTLPTFYGWNFSINVLNHNKI